MKITEFSEKFNTLYILTDAILPKGDTIEELRKAFKLSYSERIALYASDSAKAEIEKELKAHSGCKISEFTRGF